jgi:hypothetical protein
MTRSCAIYILLLGFLILFSKRIYMMGWSCSLTEKHTEQSSFIGPSQAVAYLQGRLENGKIMQMDLQGSEMWTSTLVVWGVTSCSIVDGHKRFGETYHIYLQGRILKDYTRSQSRLPQSTSSPPWERQISKHLWMFEINLTASAWFCVARVEPTDPVIGDY